MGLSLTQVAEAVNNPDRIQEVVAQFTRDLAAERAGQDAAISYGTEVLSSYAEPAEVCYRHAAAQPWVGVVVPLDRIDEVEPDTEDADRIFAGLFRALTAAGNPPVGPFWTTIRVGQSGAGELVLCWPVARPADPRFTIDDLAIESDTPFTVDDLVIESDTLPPRREAYVRVDLAATRYPDQGSGDAAPHPAFLALLDQLEDCGAEQPMVRQVGVLDDEGTPTHVELTVTITR
jgi:hypothetical protein